ncbi:hypothetical protein MHLNE_07290 [Moorella humiferrea]|uniref:HPP family protein n=1 Tax=Neomoorella humiferrea TaxID=676965 RepID=UPI0030CAB47A
MNRAAPLYILRPVAAGAVIMVLIGVLINNLSPNRRYPKYWVRAQLLTLVKVRTR